MNSCILQFCSKLMYSFFSVEYENSLESDLKGDTSGDLETLLVELSKVRAAILLITVSLMEMGRSTVMEFLR